MQELNPDESSHVIFLQSYVRTYNAKIALLILAEKHKRRSRIVQEILDTEQSYVDSLTTLIQVFLHPLRVDATKRDLLSSTQIDTIFGPLQMMVQLNTKFMWELEASLLDWCPSSRVGKVLLSLVPALASYSTYINNYNSSMEELATTRKHNRAFDKYLSTCMSNPRVRLTDIGDYLIMPVQRVPRYNLLFIELKKNTDEEHIDYKDINEAGIKLADLAENINKRKAELESITKMLAISFKLTIPPEKNEPFWFPGRLLLRDGVFFVGMSVWKNGKPIECMVILFSDQIWFAAAVPNPIPGQELYSFLFSMTLSSLTVATSASTDPHFSVRVQSLKNASNTVEIVFQEKPEMLVWFQAIKQKSGDSTTNLPAVVTKLGRSKTVGKRTNSEKTRKITHRVKTSTPEIKTEIKSKSSLPRKLSFKKFPGKITSSSSDSITKSSSSFDIRSSQVSSNLSITTPQKTTLSASLSSSPVPPPPASPFPLIPSSLPLSSPQTNSPPLQLKTSHALRDSNEGTPIYSPTDDDDPPYIPPSDLPPPPETPPPALPDTQSHVTPSMSLHSLKWIQGTPKPPTTNEGPNRLKLFSRSKSLSSKEKKTVKKKLQ